MALEVLGHLHPVRLVQPLPLGDAQPLLNVAGARAVGRATEKPAAGAGEQADGMAHLAMLPPRPDDLLTVRRVSRLVSDVLKHAPQTRLQVA